MRLLLLFSLFGLIISSCENTNDKTVMDLNAKLDSLRNENKNLNEKISRIEEKESTQPQKEQFKVPTSNDYPSNNSNEDVPTANNSFMNSKYAFVLLSITKKEFSADKFVTDTKLESETVHNPTMLTTNPVMLTTPFYCSPPGQFL